MKRAISLATLMPLVLIVSTSVSFAAPQTAGSGTKAVTPKGATAQKVYDMSKYVSADGITIPRDSPGAPEGIGALLYPAHPETEQSLPLDAKALNDIAVLRYTGIIVASADGVGRLAGGTTSFKPARIQVLTRGDQWFAISSFVIAKDGFLVVTDESGQSYRIYVGLYKGKFEKLGKK